MLFSAFSREHYRRRRVLSAHYRRVGFAMRKFELNRMKPVRLGGTSPNGVVDGGSQPSNPIKGIFTGVLVLAMIVGTTAQSASAAPPLASAAFSTATVAAAQLTTTPTPTIAGVAKVGSTLTAIPATWAPSPVKLSYKWSANGTIIEGHPRPHLQWLPRTWAKPLR